MFDAGLSLAQTARIQVIHNSADPALRWLDFYLNNALVKDSLLFRSATPYLDVPAGSGISAGLAPAGSSGPQDIFKSIPVTIQAGKQYVLVIQGVLDPSGFRKNPDGVSIEATLLVRETRDNTVSPGSSDYLFINGATDATGLTFKAGSDPALASGIGYGSSSGYVSYNKFVYTMGVSPSTATSRILGFYDLDVGFLQNEAFTILASGFVNKFENKDGPELKLFLVARDGFFRSVTASAIPTSYATMQIINNSGDIDHYNGFDILFDGGLAVNNLKFRSATATFGVPGGQNLSVQVRDSSGTQTLASSVLTTEAGKNYLLLISGVVTPSRYAPNPDGQSTALSMAINSTIRRTPANPNVGEFIFANGVTDSPPLDLEVTGADPVGALPFGQMTAYLTMPDYQPLIEAFRNGSVLPALASHVVDIPFIIGKSFVMFASGFDNPALNQNATRARLMLALKDGAVVQLDARELVLPYSRVQLIHASADPALATADIYVDEFRVGDDTPFRTGTKFFDVYSGRTITVGVAPAGSSSFRDIVRSGRMKFAESSHATAIIRGLLTPSNFAPNPDGLNTDAGIQFIQNTLEEGPDDTQLTLLLTTQVTDLPNVNVNLDEAPFATGLRYSESSSYGVVVAQNHSFDFRDATSGNRIVKSYVNFYGLRGQAGILIASGFVDSTGVNQNGAPFSSFLVLGDGSTIHFDQIFTNTESDPAELPSTLAVRGAFPNPFTTQANVVFDLPESSSVSLELFDVTGRRVSRVEPRLMTAGTERSVRLTVPDLSSGVYFYRLTAVGTSGSQSAQGELMLVR